MAQGQSLLAILFSSGQSRKASILFGAVQCRVSLKCSRVCLLISPWHDPLSKLLPAPSLGRIPPSYLSFKALGSLMLPWPFNLISLCSLGGPRIPSASSLQASPTWSLWLWCYVWILPSFTSPGPSFLWEPSHGLPLLCTVLQPRMTGQAPGSWQSHT